MTTPQVIKVMIVNDHPLLSVGTAAVVNQQSDMTIVAEAEGAGERSSCSENTGGTWC